MNNSNKNMQPALYGQELDLNEPQYKHLVVSGLT